MIDVNIFHLDRKDFQKHHNFIYLSISPLKRETLKIVLCFVKIGQIFLTSLWTMYIGKHCPFICFQVIRFTYAHLVKMACCLVLPSVFWRFSNCPPFYKCHHSLLQ